MTAVEELEQEAYDQNIPVDYVKFKSDHLHGLYIDGSIAIHSGLSTAPDSRHPGRGAGASLYFLWEYSKSARHRLPETGTSRPSPRL